MDGNRNLLRKARQIKLDIIFRKTTLILHKFILKQFLLHNNNSKHSWIRRCNSYQQFRIRIHNNSKFICLRKLCIHNK